RQKGSWLLVTGVLSGITPMAMALPMKLMHLPVAVASTAAMGATQGAFMALSGAMIQEVAPDHLRGRVSAFYLLLAGGLMAWVNLLNGALADIWGVPYLFLVPAATYLVILSFMTGGLSTLRVTFKRGTLALAASGETVPAA
ncbi:MAG: hypothetical protein HY677_06750, partial [Chloroflexi bacterium]|nr:hypothetical protein [Chloroflexota bacterium]